MAAKIFFVFSILSSSVYGQMLDTSSVKTNLNGAWEFQYELNSEGQKSYLRFGPEDNDSSLLIQVLIFDGYQISSSEMFNYNPSEKIEQQGVWSFWTNSNGIFILVELEDLFFSGIYEVKRIDSNQMILIECDKHEDCDELYFGRM
jgi:hypothetical protein